jgi:hypothetical protein
MNPGRRIARLAVPAVMSLLAMVNPMNAHADKISFDTDSPGSLPLGWKAGVTGNGSHRWAVRQDASAPSPPNVMQQSGAGSFPWLVRSGTLIDDGFVEVRFKALAGREDQAGGVVWRWKDGDNYYVARANALENNVSLYYTQNGRRITLKYVDAPVPPKTWHTLRVEFAGRHIAVSFNGKNYIEMDDDRIAGAGAVGLWTKADSVTAFDDFSFASGGPARR